jgi:hypothetical protein
LCRFVDQTLKVPSVGTLTADDLVGWQQGPQRVEAFDAHLQQAHPDAGKATGRPVFRQWSISSKGAQETDYSYCHTQHIHHFGKPRLVSKHRQAALSDSATYFISNKLNWQAGGLTRIRRHRWPVAVSHAEGKAEGLDQDHVRDGEAISRPIALVAGTESLRRAAQHDEALLHKLQRHVQTTLDGSAGSWRRNTQAQTLWTLATCIAFGLSQGQTRQDVMEPLLAVFAY